MTYDILHVTCARWHMTGGGISLAFTVWELSFFFAYKNIFKLALIKL